MIIIRIIYRYVTGGKKIKVDACHNRPVVKRFSYFPNFGRICASELSINELTKDRDPIRRWGIWR